MRVFSGIQPTGDIHIGNFTGALKQWTLLQKENECIFCIVDLHALTVPYDVSNLQSAILEKAVAYLAAGISPERSIIFVQSHVKEHTELCWLLNTITPLGDLERMTQYKDKSKKFAKNLNAGLLNYPVLMAADILLYKTDVVPVGLDQKQHVELARAIAQKFNKKFGEIFKIPKVVIPKIGAKVMSLKEPEKKMSKSDPDDTRINLFDSEEKIEKKIMSAVTDSGKEVKYDERRKPGISNLLTIYSLFSEKEIKEIEKEFKGKTYSEFKKNLVQVLSSSLKPFREKKKEFEGNKSQVVEILKKGEEKARKIAENTIGEVRQRMGLI